MERALAPSLEETRVDEALEVMTERRGRHVHVRLDFSSGGSLRASLHDEADDGEARRVTEGTQLFGMALEFRRHGGIILTNSKNGASVVPLDQPARKSYTRRFMRQSAIAVLLLLAGCQRTTPAGAELTYRQCSDLVRRVQQLQSEDTGGMQIAMEVRFRADIDGCLEKGTPTAYGCVMSAETAKDLDACDALYK